MKQLPFYRIIYSFLILVLVACAKDKKAPENKVNKDVDITVETGNNQFGIYGELLPDVVDLQVASSTGKTKFRYTFEIIKGNGKISTLITNISQINEVDATGHIKLKWTLGCDLKDQQIKVTVYPDSIINGGYVVYSNVPGATITLSAVGDKPPGWGKSCGCEKLDNNFSKIVSINPDKLYLISNGLYLSTDGGKNWLRQYAAPGGETVSDGFFNSKGWLYLITRAGGAYYTKDMVKWEEINNGLLEKRDPTLFWGDDELLFAAFYQEGIYMSENNGAFWRKLIINPGSQRFFNLQRAADGRIFVWDDWGDLFVSADKAKTWSRLEVQHKYTGSTVHDFKVGSNGMWYIGGSDANMAIISPQTLEGEVHNYYEQNHSTQHVDGIQFLNNDVYYNVRFTPKPGIYSKNAGWARLPLDFPFRINYYYAKKNGGFLRLSDDGLYYKE